MKIKNLLLVCSLFLAGGVVATGAEQANNVREVAAETAKVDLSSLGLNNAVSVAGTEFDINGVATVTFNKGDASNAPAYYTSGTSVRVYAKANFVVASQYTMTQIKLTYGSSDKTNAITTDVGTFSTNTWTGESQKVTFTIGGTKNHRRIKSVEVTYSMGDNSTYSVEFDATPSTFVDGAGEKQTGNSGENYVATLPLQSDLVDEGKFDNGYAQVTGWKATINNVENEYDFGAEVTVSEYTKFKTTHTQLVSDLTIKEAYDLGLACTSIYKYNVEGTIATIDTAYDSGYGNITVTITDGTNSIKCFRLAGGDDLFEGTKIRVNGNLTNYKSAPQFDQGATYEIIENASEETVFQDAQTTTKLTASYDSTVESSEEDTYSYEVNTKVFNGYGQETLLGEKMWIANSDNGTPGSVDNTYKRGQQFGSSSAAPKYLTLTSVEEFVGVTEIIVDANAGTSTTVELSVTVGGVQIGDTVAKINNVTTTLGSYTFTSETPLNGRIEITYTQTSGTKAVYFKGVSVSYSSQVKSYAVADASIGFASLIDAVAYDENANYGILVVPTEDLADGMVIGDYHDLDLTTTLANLAADEVRVANYECEPVRVDANGDADEEGEFYQFGVLFTECLAKIDFSLTAVAYMELDGELYFTANETSYSLRSLAQAYLDGNVMAGKTDAVGVLEAIVNYGL